MPHFAVGAMMALVVLRGLSGQGHLAIGSAGFAVGGPILFVVIGLDLLLEGILIGLGVVSVVSPPALSLAVELAH